VLRFPFPAASVVVAALALLGSCYAKVESRPAAAVRPLPAAAQTPSPPPAPQEPRIAREGLRLSVPPAPPAAASPVAAAAPAPTTEPRATATRAPSATAPPPAAAAAAPTRKPTPRPTAAQAGAASTQQALTNQARADAGLPALAWSACLAGIAERHAAEMAQAGRIYHGDGVQQALGCGLGSSRSGENVGFTSPGVDDNRVFTAFMQSPGHRDNILGSYRYIGTAWVVGADGAGYLSVEFA
jgi:uncharacterized protein YkwD